MKRKTAYVCLIVFVWIIVVVAFVVSLHRQQRRIREGLCLIDLKSARLGVVSYVEETQETTDLNVLSILNERPDLMIRFSGVCRAVHPKLKLKLPINPQDSDYEYLSSFEYVNDPDLPIVWDKNLLGRTTDDLSICGYVGEEIAKKVCYLSATSRITKRPLSVIIRSSSAAGKSELMEKVALLMPSEEVSSYSRITPQALYYMEKDKLKYKLLIVDERAGSEDADYSIRNLQSREKLTLAVVIKDPSSGKSRTATLELEGPCVIWESTTQPTLNAENSSRCFEIWLDEGSKQTQRIHHAQREEFGAEGWRREDARARIIRTHQNAQRLLRPLRVEIPYRDKLTFPSGWMRTRRDHQRFLSLIAVIALLHQYQRKVKTTPAGQKYIEATVEDYKEAFDLARHALKGSLSHIQKDSQDLLGELFRMVAERAKEAGLSPTSAVRGF